MIHKHRVRALLMGGQACVFYGAAEFSRDIDFVVLVDPGNLARLRKALTDLMAESIAVPGFSVKHLRRGHAVHFRCQDVEAAKLRVDIMAKMRGVDSFAALWRRRTVIALDDGTECPMLSIVDLVKAKKTQRNKDWPMIQRLVETHYFENRKDAKPARVKFWLRELRTAGLLIELAAKHGGAARKLAAERPLLTEAIAGRLEKLETALVAEESEERKRDAAYWKPLKAELETMRHAVSAARRKR